jgi:type II secretory ATPase GspE/PulE/Tfp pilus assembly ATPase PilB-like protein
VLLDKVQKILSEIPENAGVEVPEKLQFYHSLGCDSCAKLGYKGRAGVYEVIEVNDSLRELIIKEASVLDIKKAARANGTMSMIQAGLLLALNKVTDVEEVFRVVG